MNTKILKIFLTVILFIVLIVLALPEFSFTVGGNTYTYPSVGFSRIGIGADYGSFDRGKDVFASEKFSGEINFGEEEISNEEKKAFLEKAVETINNRIQFAQINDIDVYGEIVNDSYILNLSIPRYYTEKEDYASWLLSQGDVTFRYLVDPADPSSQLDFNVKVSDIKSVSFSNNLRFQQNVDAGDETSQTRQTSITASNLVIKVDERRVEELRILPNFVTYYNRFFSGEELGSNLVVDGTKTLQLIRDDNNETTMRALILDSEAAKASFDSLNIVHSYFREEAPLEYPITLNEQSSAIAPSFNPQGTTFIALSIIVGLGLLVLNLGKSIKTRRSIFFVSSISFTLLVLITILKFVQTPISSGFIIGVLTIITIYSFIILDLINSDDKEVLRTKSFDYFALGIISILAFISIHIFSINLGVFAQTLEVLVAGFIALLIAIFLHIHFVTTAFIIERQNITKLLGFRRKYE